MGFDKEKYGNTMSRQTLRLFLLLFVCNALAALSCDTGGTNATIYISSQQDATVLSSSCSTWNGDISIIAADITGNITLDGLVTIQGSLYINGTGQVTGLSSQTLKTISGNLTIDSVPSLKSIELPALATVGGPVRFSRLDSLVTVNLAALNAVDSLFLISLPRLPMVKIFQGEAYGTTMGLHNITNPTDPRVEIIDVGLTELGGLVDTYDANALVISGVPQLNHATVFTGHIKTVQINGNGNLTFSLVDISYQNGSRTAHPLIETLNITGVKHVNPCEASTVHEFIAINNTVQYLHFDFFGLRRLEIRDNPDLKMLLPRNGADLSQWELSDVLITGNPLLQLTEFPVRSPDDDDLTKSGCLDVYSSRWKDTWKWYPFHMNTTVISANIDNTFL
jgi:hypothetical protein